MPQTSGLRGQIPPSSRISKEIRIADTATMCARPRNVRNQDRTRVLLDPRRKSALYWQLDYPRRDHTKEIYI